jgi:hypothetical protein
MTISGRKPCCSATSSNTNLIWRLPISVRICMTSCNKINLQTASRQLYTNRLRLSASWISINASIRNKKGSCLTLPANIALLPKRSPSDRRKQSESNLEHQAVRPTVHRSGNDGQCLLGYFTTLCQQVRCCSVEWNFRRWSWKMCRQECERQSPWHLLTYSWLI